jgi:hypothetical protein
LVFVFEKKLWSFLFACSTSSTPQRSMPKIHEIWTYLGDPWGKNITEHHGTTILETRVSLFGYLLVFVCDMGQTWVPLKMPMDDEYDRQWPKTKFCGPLGRKIMSIRDYHRISIYPGDLIISVSDGISRPK